MIIWQGFGVIALLIPILVSVLTEASLDGAFGKGYYAAHPLALTLSLLISAVIVWFVGARLNNAPGRVLVDPESGQKVELKKRHTLFWIPMQWFGLVIAAVGVGMAFA